MTDGIPSPEKVTETVGIVAIDNGKVLLVRHEEGAQHITGVYGLPAGRIEVGETALEAAAREFSEETGLKADREDFSEFDGNLYHAEIMRKSGNLEKFNWQVFRVRNFSGELKGSDEVTPEWVKIVDLEQMRDEGKLLPNTTAAVLAAIKG